MSLLLFAIHLIFTIFAADLNCPVRWVDSANSTLGWLWNNFVLEIYNQSIDRNLIHRWLYDTYLPYKNFDFGAICPKKKHKILQLDAGPDKYHAGPAELQQRLWWRLCRGCSADTGGPCLGSGSSLLGVFLFELGFGAERSKDIWWGDHWGLGLDLCTAMSSKIVMVLESSTFSRPNSAPWSSTNAKVLAKEVLISAKEMLISTKGAEWSREPKVSAGHDQYRLTPSGALSHL